MRTVVSVLGNKSLKSQFIFLHSWVGRASTFVDARPNRSMSERSEVGYNSEDFQSVIVFL